MNRSHQSRRRGLLALLVLPLAALSVTIPADLATADEGAGSGSTALVLAVSQDAYQGSARYTVAVDGTQVGDEFTASARHGSGETDTVTVRGDWGPGEHVVVVNFLNDLWDGTADTDRNLYVEGITADGRTVAEGRTLYSAGSVDFRVDLGGETSSDWEQVYADDFSSGALNPDGWEAVQGVSGHSKVNWVKDRVSVADGVATLTVDTRANEAGAIMTKNRVVQSYGRYSVRARIDEGKGVGLALLLWPTSEQWPNDGEIDFAEMPRRDAVHFTNHWGTPDNHQYQSESMPLDATQWHTYGVEWTSNRLAFLVDGEVRSVITENVPTGPMFLGMQTEYMGSCTNGDWIPCPDETTPDLVRAQLDDVRIDRWTGQ